MHAVEEFLFYSNAKFSIPVIVNIFSQLCRLVSSHQGSITYADVIQTVKICGKGLSTQEVETYCCIFHDICFVPGEYLQFKREYATPDENTFLINLVPFVQQYSRGKLNHPSIRALQQEDIDQHLSGGSGMPPARRDQYQ